VDYVPSLLDAARRRAEAEGLEIRFEDGDAEAIPAEDASFDVVLSTFGSMFAPDHQQAADELLRVCRPGGRIGMANWVPDGAGGALFGTVAKYVPPPAGVASPALWGTEDHLRALFGPDVELSTTRRSMNFRFPSLDFWVDFFGAHFGPTLRAFQAVGPDGEAALRADFVAALSPYNIADDDTLVLQQDYLEVIARKPENATHAR